MGPVEQTFICPHCGGEVPVKASACPHCGSDEKTGWSPESMVNDGYVEEEFDYQQALEREFGSKKQLDFKKTFLGIVAAILVILFFFLSSGPDF